MEAPKLSLVGSLGRRVLLLQLAVSLDRLRQLNHRVEDYLDQLHQLLSQEDCLDLQLHNRNLEVFLGLRNPLLDRRQEQEVYLDLHNLLKVVVDCLEILAPHNQLRRVDYLEIQVLRSQLRRVDYSGLHNLSKVEDYSEIPVPVLHSQPKQADCSGP